jgi:hypothetical protein
VAETDDEVVGYCTYMGGLGVTGGKYVPSEMVPKLVWASTPLRAARKASRSAAYLIMLFWRGVDAYGLQVTIADTASRWATGSRRAMYVADTDELMEACRFKYNWYKYIPGTVVQDKQEANN